MPKLWELLQDLGFDRAEAEVYDFLLHQGVFSVGTLAKRLGLPRTTLYTLLGRLSARGLVRETVKKGLKAYMAEPPETISHLFSQRISETQQNSQAFAALLPDLRKNYRSSAATPRLSVFEGKAGIENVLRDMLLYSDLETWAVWPIRKMMGALSPEFFKFHNKERIRRNIYTSAVWPHSEVVAVSKFPFLGWGKEFKREIRVAPEEVNYPLGYWIYANKVAFLSSADEGYGFIIQSQELVITLKAQFQLLWQLSKPLPFDKKDVEKFVQELG